MASLTSTSRTLLRALPRTSLSSLPVRALSTSSSKCGPGAADTSSFDSPFRGFGGSKTAKIPDFSHYKSNKSQTSNQMFQYFMVGTMGALTAAGAKNTVQGTFRDFYIGNGVAKIQCIGIMA
jgi:ubiquinol-cytochrome c reductase iron-sulfur subunit